MESGCSGKNKQQEGAEETRVFFFFFFFFLLIVALRFMEISTILRNPSNRTIQHLLIDRIPIVQRLCCINFLFLSCVHR